MIRRLGRFSSEEDGADMVEYACIVGLLALVCFLTLQQTATSVGDLFSKLSTGLNVLLP